MKVYKKRGPKPIAQSARLAYCIRVWVNAETDKKIRKQARKQDIAPSELVRQLLCDVEFAESGDDCV